MSVDFICYLNKKDLLGITTITGRPGVNKDWFTLNLIKGIDNDNQILYLSLEDSVDDIKIKYYSLCEESNYDLVKKVEDEYNSYLALFDKNISNVKVKSDIKTINDLEAYLKDNHVNYVVIDYLELFQCNNYEELKKISNKYHVNFILISELGRFKNNNDFALFTDLKENLVNISDKTILISQVESYIQVDVYEKGTIALYTKQKFHDNLKTFSDYFDEDLIYHYVQLDTRIKYLKENTHILDKIDINEIKDVIDDFFHHTYILLKNGDLIIDHDEIINNIESIHFQSAFHLFAISKDARIIPLSKKLDEMEKYLANEDIPYQKIISKTLFLAGLTQDGVVKFVTCTPDVSIKPGSLVNVKDIGYIEDDDILIISHDGNHYENLFLD